MNTQPEHLTTPGRKFGSYPWGILPCSGLRIRNGLRPLRRISQFRFDFRLHTDALLAAAVVALPLALSSAEAPRLKRADSFLGVHFDFHAGPDCTEIGKNTTPEMIEDVIDQGAPGLPANRLQRASRADQLPDQGGQPGARDLWAGTRCGCGAR